MPTATAAAAAAVTASVSGGCGPLHDSTCRPRSEICKENLEEHLQLIYFACIFVQVVGIQHPLRPLKKVETRIGPPSEEEKGETRSDGMF